ncbi:MAG: hypothetical protein ACRD5M_16325 [Candidatus Acidiferrales bacterium]
MRKLPRARITAPAVHAFLFALAYAFWLLFEKGTHSPGRFDLLAVLWLADLPISVLASSITLGSPHYAGFAFAVWGVFGTIWWYFLGISIEAWVKRFSGKAQDHA